MKSKSSMRKGFTLVELLVVIVIIAALAGLTAPMVIRQARKADLAEATSNARQIGIAMFEFQQEYGKYPDSTTQTQVETNFPSAITTANTSDSNGYFRQLFASEITKSEQMFYAKTGATIKPDGIIKGDDCLKSKECGFGYILDGTNGLTATGNPARVLAVSPLKAGATTFNKDPFDKKAVLLRIDNSVVAFTINDSGDVVIGGGKKLTDSGADSIWEDITPEIKPPGTGS